MRTLLFAQVAVASAYTMTGFMTGNAAMRARGVAPQMIELIKPANVDQAKKQFNAAYGRPVSSTAQGFVSEIIQSTCFALQSPNYAYSRVYAVGFEALCKVFLESCPSDADREAIRSSMCIALGMDPAQVRRDSEELTALADGMAEEELLATSDFKDISAINGFKYTYTLGAGLITLMPVVGTEPTAESIDRWCSGLNIGASRLQTDYAYYKSSLEKVAQVKEMMLQMQVASKKAEAKRLAAKAEAAAKEAEEEEAKEAAASTPPPSGA